MAITQDRMLAIIAAGNAWRKAYEDLEEALALHLKFYDLGDIKIESLVPSLHALSRATMPRPSDVVALFAEERHYQTNAKKNDSAKRRAAGARAMAGAKPQANRLAQKLPNPSASMPSSRDFERALEEQKREEQRAQAERARKLQAQVAAQQGYKFSPEYQELVNSNPALENINDPALALKIEDLF